jgi:endonuclease G
MPTKTDREQLKGILGQFDRSVIDEVLNDYLKKIPCGISKRRRDFPPPGSEVEVGTYGNRPLESRSDIERIIDESNLLPVAFLEEGAVRQKAVARLPKISGTNPLGTPWGTGFLVSKSLIMTNNHVIGTVAEAKEILVQFNYQIDYNNAAQPIDTWHLDPANFFYTNAALDFTLVRAKGKPVLIIPNIPRLPMLVLSEMEEAEIEGKSVDISVGTVKPLLRYPGQKWGYLQLSTSLGFSIGQFLNVIQHPAGRMKEVALQKNQVTHVFTDRIHYTTDTEPGSSGSPVLNNEWGLVALHHAAGDWDSVANKWIDNEGMRIDSIVNHLRTQFSTSNPALLTELGIQ